MKTLYFFLFFLFIVGNTNLQVFSAQPDAKTLPVAGPVKPDLSAQDEAKSEAASSSSQVVEENTSNESSGTPEEKLTQSEAENSLPEETSQAVDTDKAFEDLDFKGSFFRMIIALVLIIALAFLTLNYVVPKLTRRRLNGVKTEIRVLERIPLDAKKHLYVIEAENRRLLISATEHSVGLITELKPHEHEAEQDI